MYLKSARGHWSSEVPGRSEGRVHEDSDAFKYAFGGDPAISLNFTQNVPYSALITHVK